MYKGYKYRIYPTDAQKEQIEKTFGVCRLVYNLALQVNIEAYRANGTKLRAFDLCYQLTELKKEYDWIHEVDSQALQASIKKLDISFKKFYHGSGFPKFKSKNDRQSFQCPTGVRRIDFEKGLLAIPKIKKIPINISRIFEGKIKTVTISRTLSGKYFASILVDMDIQAATPQPIAKETTIGLDTGIKSFVISSDGRTFEANRHLKANLERLKVLQRRASKKKKGSKNRKKANKKVALLYESISNKRLDYIHKTTSALCDDQASTICVEDLNVSGLLKNHKIAQAMSDVSLSKFYEILEYKCKWKGINLIKINRFAPSSKRCSCCGHIKESLLLSEREWQCVNCSTVHDRDKNAAENIKWYGLETIFNNNTPMGSRGEPVEQSALGDAMKQEKF